MHEFVFVLVVVVVVTSAIIKYVFLLRRNEGSTEVSKNACVHIRCVQCIGGSGSCMSSSTTRSSAAVLVVVVTVQPAK